MAKRNLSEIFRYLRLRTQPDGAGASDGELLERYVHLRDEAAFELLLWRHGALVFNVCRRILHGQQDAEDAFQATFLAFVRKAGSIGRRASVASWLYKVAYRVALAAKERARKKAAREKTSGEEAVSQTITDPLWSELRSILDEEINRLPERLRQAFVLCYLEGKTNEEAARQFGCRPGTIFSRLARGREILRKRLLRRGVTPAVAGLTALLAEQVSAVVPEKLMTGAVRSALLYAAGPSASGISPQVMGLTEGVLRAMFVAKLKLTVLLVLTVGLFAAGGVLTRQAWTAAPPAAQEEFLQPPAAGQVAKDDKEKKPVVSVVHPKPGGVPRLWQHNGHVRAAAQQQVYATVSGYLRRQTVDLGDRVKKGQVLAEIWSPALEMEVSQARAALSLEKLQIEMAETQFKTAEANVKAATERVAAYDERVRSDDAYMKYRKQQFDRYQKLYAERAIEGQLVDEQTDRCEAAKQAVVASRMALQSARADVLVQESKVPSARVAVEIAKAKFDMARLAVDKAQAQLGLAQIRANFDGVVTQRNFNEGDFLAANEGGTRLPLLTLMRTDSVRVSVDVKENEIYFTHPGNPVEVFSQGEIPYLGAIDAKISRTGFAVEERSHTMPVEIDVPNPKNLLRPGMTIVVRLECSPPNLFTVPKSAVLVLENQTYVYVFHDGKAHLTPVNVGPMTDDGTRWEIASGLQATDRIVVDPTNLKGKVVPVEIKKTP
jgi:HlyD family secretion protein